VSEIVMPTGDEIDIAIPAVASGPVTIARWFVAEGASFSRGDRLCELETDTASVGFEAPAAGMLVYAAAEGRTLRAGSLLARMRLA
jgi:pyruvate/2-oxoglutarate dehydrogenase complex dihydrolipoamide acyltransferase (E2) component